MNLQRNEEESLLPVILGTHDDSRTTETDEKQCRHFTSGEERTVQWSWKATMIHVTVFSVYSLLFAWAWQDMRSSCLSRKSVVFVPYQGRDEGITFEHEHSIYVGVPSHELDNAWAKLLRNTNVRVTEHEMSRIPGRKEQAIPLPDGGYFGTLNVYHNLHCVKRLYYYMYKDHYFPNVTQDQSDALEYHNHHCLDMLRQSVMCQGDTQLLTMKWRTDGRVPTANFTMPHKCVNWEGLEDWAASRRISKLIDPGYLIHPTLGPAYPDGKGDKIGEFSTGHE